MGNLGKAEEASEKGKNIISLSEKIKITPYHATTDNMSGTLV